MERTLLVYLNKNQEIEENNDQWMCECKNINDSSWNVCNNCNKIKPGVQGWVCKICTFINENIYKICKGCGERKEEESTTINGY